MKPHERIIFPLDVYTASEANFLIDTLASYVGFFKVGLALSTSLGTPDAIKMVRERGGRVFLDAKFSDIPNTIKDAVSAAADLGSEIISIHASAGTASIRAAVENKKKAKIWGVTILSSLEEDECRSIFGEVPSIKVLQFASLLSKEGVDGIICSPQELELIRGNSEFDGLSVATPGIRPHWASKNDQKRTLTPKEAIEKGADYLIVGRPVRQPPPGIGTSLDAIQRIEEEISDIVTQ